MLPVLIKSYAVILNRVLKTANQKFSSNEKERSIYMQMFIVYREVFNNSSRQNYIHLYCVGLKICKAS